ncbi:MAG: RecT family recombinase [Desulfuromonadaceae bacterium]
MTEDKTEPETKALAPWVETIRKTEDKFHEITKASGTEVAFAVESMFAFQAVSRNDYTKGIAEKNLPSLRDAIINIASIGLSLNPAMQYAYLVPRDGAICLDISYKGLIKLATDTGSMLWVRADLVYERDQFTYRGPATAPTHEADVFGDRGAFVGVYCIAKTIEGDILVEVMTAKEIEQVRDTSQAWAKKKAGPWRDWFGEMTKKTIIKRASKTWPRSDKNDRLAQAVEVINQHEGFAPDVVDAVQMLTDEQENEIHAFIEDNNLDRQRFFKTFHIDSIGQLSPKDFPRAMVALKAMVGR